MVQGVGAETRLIQPSGSARRTRSAAPGEGLSAPSEVRSVIGSDLNLEPVADRLTEPRGHTSLTRTDTGPGACEVMLVRDVEVERYP